MKVSVLWVLCFVVGTVLMVLNFSCATNSLLISGEITMLIDYAKKPFAIGGNEKTVDRILLVSALTLFYSDAAFTDRTSGMTTAATSRKLKENRYNPSTDRRSNTHTLNLEDYHPIDPVPSSKASVKPGPIEHGTPLNPYIPKPSPPSPHPKKISQLP